MIFKLLCTGIIVALVGLHKKSLRCVKAIWHRVATLDWIFSKRNNKGWPFYDAKEDAILPILNKKLTISA